MSKSLVLAMMGDSGSGRILTCREAIKGSEVIPWCEPMQQETQRLLVRFLFTMNDNARKANLRRHYVTSNLSSVVNGYRGYDV
jgi:type II secretory pathway predicted ATPase ExeA